jgi:hypothetical protein
VDPVEKLQLLLFRLWRHLQDSIKVLAIDVVTMGTRPEDVEAKARREGGLTRAIQVDRTEPSCPSRGGSRGYDGWFRAAELLRFANGEAITASLSSIYRWQEDGLERKRQTGNEERETLVGIDQIYLAILLFAFPKVQFDEITVFLYDRGGNIYTREAISKRLKE